MAVRTNYFLPFMRQGIAALADPSPAPGKRTVIPVRVRVRAEEKGRQPIEETIEQEVALFGPGDVLGIDQRAVSRMAPPPDTENFDTSLTPFIQFSEPDLLWRYSTRKAADNRHWLPWLSLVVLKVGNDRDEGEFRPLANQRPELPARIQLMPHATLPDLNESWRWAHVHVLEVEGRSFEQIRGLIQQSPKRAVCRLLSARRLEPETRYHAFVVPTYRIGMEAALGFGDGVNDRTLLSWDTPIEGAGKILPYYLQWKFRTGTRGDFKYLVRILKPRMLDGMGTRTIDCSNPGYGLRPDVQAMELEGALRSLDTQYQRWGMDQDAPPATTQKILAGLLNKREETSDTGETILRVTPPVYGEWHAGTNGKAVKVDPDNRRHWLEELNLDFRHRAAAGLGAQFVKQNQESLMKAAWEQFTRVKMVNRALSLGRFGRQVSLSMHKRLDVMSDDGFLRLSLPLQHKIASQQEATATTVSAALKGRSVAPSLSRVTLKKLMLGKSAPVTARTRFLRSGAQSLTSFTAIPKTQVVASGFQMRGLASHHPPTKPPEPAEPDPQLFRALGQATRAALHPTRTIENKLSARFRSFRQLDKGLRSERADSRGIRSAAVQPAALDPLRPVMWHPEFHRPMYRFLRDLSQGYILPGMNDVPPNTVGLLQTNRRFIEAFMVGLNHEFASELRWREFPTDIRGSYFRSFWDTTIYSLDDAERLQFRNTDVGKSLLQVVSATHGAAFDTFEKIEAAYAKAEPPSDAENEVADAYEAAVEQWLLAREEDKDIDHLSEWRPDTRLGSHPAAGNWNDEEENDNQIVLLIRGELLQKFSNTLIYLVGKSSTDPHAPDLTSAGARLFPIFEGAFPPDTVFLGFPITPSDFDGYFVIFEERMTDLRFGLDVAAFGAGENDFSWEHFSASEGEYLDGRQPAIFQDKWNSATYIAKVMTQKQVRVAMELTRFIPGRP